MSTLLLALFLLDTPKAVASPSPAPSPSPSPAVAAPSRKRETIAEAAARRGAAAGKKPAPAKVLTNEDLDKAREGGAAVSVLAGDGVEPPPMDSGSASDVVTPAPAMSDEERSWRERSKEAHGYVAQSQQRIEEAELKLAQLRDNLRPGSPMDPNQQQTREAEIQAATNDLEEARLALAAARQRLSDLEDEARRASIPAGWLSQP